MPSTRSWWFPSCCLPGCGAEATRSDTRCPGRTLHPIGHTIGTIHARSSPAGALARLTDDTVLRLKVRRARRSALHIFVCARPLDEPTGAQMLQLHEVPAWRDLPPGQWGEITLRLADFEQSPATSSGPRGVHYIAITTYEADAGLERTEIALEPR